MAKRVGGSRRKARDKLKKTHRTKGKISVTKYLLDFQPGDKVILKNEPGVQKGTYHMRFHRKYGIVQKKQGTCYVVKIKDINKEKLLVLHPIHLEKIV